jgi:hypothetical protein
VRVISGSLLLLPLALSACPLAPPEDAPPAGDEPCDAADAGASFGLLDCDDGGAAGAVLIAPNSSRSAVLIDRGGRVLHTWESGWTPGMATVLGPDGTLVRAGRGGAGLQEDLGGLPGAGGILEQRSWDGDVEWSWPLAGPAHLAHHDVQLLPDGHVLALVWEVASRPEAIALGRDPDALAPRGLLFDSIHEIDPATGETVWRWSSRDHLVQDFDPAAPDFGAPVDAPGRIDLNAAASNQRDWLHFNGLDHDPATDLIVLSVHGLDEIWVLDHGVPAEQTAGPRGDLLFRWGRPGIWGGQGEQELFGQHDPTWVGGDRVLVFDNGVGRPAGLYSRLVEVEIPFADGRPVLARADEPPEGPAWTWTAPTPSDFVAPMISGAQRLPSGRTLVTNGPQGRVFELDTDGEIVWDYVNPLTADGARGAYDEGAGGGNAVFAARAYAADGPELGGFPLEPGAPLVATP